MIDLRVIPQPYENLPAFVSIGTLLVGGWVAQTVNEATALVEGNKVSYSIRLNGANARSWTLTEQLPNEILPVGNPFLAAFIDGVASAVKITNRMMLIPEQSRGASYPSDVVIVTGIMPRRVVS